MKTLRLLVVAFLSMFISSGNISAGGSNDESGVLLAANANTSGKCGDNLIWTYNSSTKTLTISGTGRMEYYGMPVSPPWYGYRGEITALVIGDGVTSIDINAFIACTKLTSITIGNGLFTIPQAEFHFCSSLTSVTIGSSMTSIGGGAFGDCTSMTQIVSYAITPPTCGNDVFSNIDFTTCKLIVPEGSVDAYKNAEPWKNFLNITVTAISTIEADNKVGVQAVYGIDGRQQNGVKHGLNIIRKSDGTAKKIVVK